MEEIQKVYLSLEKKNSIPDNELIVVWARPYGIQRDKTYQVRKFKHQYEPLLEIANLLSEQDDNFSSRLVETDKRKSDSIPNRRRRISKDRSNLPGRHAPEVQGFYVELNHDIRQKRKLARTMCDVADVEFLKERPKL